MTEKNSPKKNEAKKETPRSFCNECEATWTVIVVGKKDECPECGSKDIETTTSKAVGN